ncbi:hypothetical protein CV595_00010 [Campylobacter coli]|nr:hypothetical protein [Campylobacter coli]EAK4432174.1 hypothetical protein [Campylobacter coli]
MINRSGLKSIVIQGLFEKYDYKINFENGVKILLSENGYGKTTVLNIINSILERNVNYLADLDFKSVDLAINDKTYHISKILNKDDASMIEEYLKHLDGMYDVGFFLKEIKQRKINIKKLKYLIYNRTEQNRRIYPRRLIDYVDKINDIVADYLYKQIEKIEKINFKVLFYPTYRRVEAALEEVVDSDFFDEEHRFLTRRNLRYRNSYRRIEFGMDDVKHIIQNKLNEIKNEANELYVNMSSEIINDLIDDKVKCDKKDIDIDKVKIVIKRIGESRIKHYDKLENIINTQDKKNEFLTYYLDKLSGIYDKQKALDLRLSNFEKVCNKYLIKKQIQYDDTLLSMKVLDDEREIDFDSLSSGEKQIISIFAKVYLDMDTKCIFIIDEPELSLSVEWQRTFLQDIYESNNIELLLATTHSPFIYDNIFEDYIVDLEKYRVNNG